MEPEELHDPDEYLADLDEEARDQALTEGRTNVTVNELVEEEGDLAEPEGDPDDPDVPVSAQDATDMDDDLVGGRI